MGLGSSSRISRRRDLIISINLERSYQGMQMDGIQNLTRKLNRMTTDELQNEYKQVFGERKDMNSERKGESKT